MSEEADSIFKRKTKPLKKFRYFEEEELATMDYRNPRDVIDNYHSLSDEEQKLVFQLILTLLSS